MVNTSFNNNTSVHLLQVPGTGDDCCGPRKKCKVVPTEDCPPVVMPKEQCGYGQKHKLIEAPGVCPQYACVCVDPKDCPDIELPDDNDLKPGLERIESVVLGDGFVDALPVAWSYIDLKSVFRSLIIFSREMLVWWQVRNGFWTIVGVVRDTRPSARTSARR